MITYRPKEQFQKNADERARWRGIATDPLLHKALATTQAEMACAGFGKEENIGVAAFIVRLLNLSEAEEEKKPIPVKVLTSYDTTTTPPKKD